VTAGHVRVGPEWLALRERADAAARSTALAAMVQHHLGAVDRWLIHDLACGSGAMGRWLAPLLSGEQRWVLHDHDPDLLALAARQPPVQADDRGPAQVEPRPSDVTALHAVDLAGATLITASALLDLLTAEELHRIAGACMDVACPVLLALSVTGAVELSPTDPLDEPIAAAFDDHQRRPARGGRLLGPDAPAAAAEAFRGTGSEVVLRPSPWRLGPADARLAVAWLTGWVGAAREQRPDLAGEAGPYLAKRIEQARGGRLTAHIGHVDLLVLP
jgi:hypothetical protein